jgi:hypothetical protein
VAWQMPDGLAEDFDKVQSYFKCHGQTEFTKADFVRVLTNASVPRATAYRRFPAIQNLGVIAPGTAPGTFVFVDPVRQQQEDIKNEIDECLNSSETAVN